MNDEDSVRKRISKLIASEPDTFNLAHIATYGDQSDVSGIAEKIEYYLYFRAGALLEKATGRPSSTAKIQGAPQFNLWAEEERRSSLADLSELLEDAILSGDVSKIERIADALKMIKQRGYTPMSIATEEALLSVKPAHVVREGKWCLSKLPVKIETARGILSKAERDELIRQSESDDALFYRGLEAIRKKHRVAIEVSRVGRVADPVRREVLKLFDRLGPLVIITLRDAFAWVTNELSISTSRTRKARVRLPKSTGAA